MRKNGCMINIFDYLKINIKVRDFDDPVIVIATLNFNSQLEVRFCPIRWKKNRSAIFFNMPALQSKGYQKCVVILKEDEYKKLAELVLTKFLDIAHEQFNMYEFDMVKTAVENNKKPEVEEINLNDIQI